jgi:hypothetical protein
MLGVVPQNETEDAHPSEVNLMNMKGYNIVEIGTKHRHTAMIA